MAWTMDQQYSRRHSIAGQHAMQDILLLLGGVTTAQGTFGCVALRCGAQRAAPPSTVRRPISGLVVERERDAAATCYPIRTPHAAGWLWDL